MSLRCNQCEQDLAPHCREPKEPEQARCDWWTCTNTHCDAAIYDVTRGVLIHVGGQVEQLGA